MTTFVPCIDLGHGGASLGAVRPATSAWPEIREKDINLELGRRLNASFAGSEIVPVMTRDGDYDPSWAARYRIAKEAEARFVLSLHANFHPTASYIDGAEAYRYPGNDETETIGHRWLASMPSELRTDKVFAATDLPGPDDDWLQRPRVILEAFRELPVLVAEVGYLSNDYDAGYLMSPWALDAVVCSLRLAIVEAARLYSR